MKTFLLFILFTALFFTQIATARTIVVDVHGMTCAFCVDSLERKFGEMKSISKVEISLKHKKIRLETSDTSPTVEAIKQTVLDAGFTPTKIEVVSNEKEPK